jgi:hypothetical protein
MSLPTTCTLSFGSAICASLQMEKVPAEAEGLNHGRQDQTQEHSPKQ